MTVSKREDLGSPAGAASAGTGSGEVSQHTPTPWVYGGLIRRSNFAAYTALVQADNCNLVSVRGGVKDDRATAAANARFIVTACNAHDDLVAALRELNRAVDRMWNDRTAPRPGTAHEVAICQAQHMCLAALDKATHPLAEGQNRAQSADTQI